MNDGVKILLARMETHPEEFIDGAQYGANKWSRLMQEYRPFLDKEDLEVFDAAHKATVFEYMKERFTQLVMEELLDPKSEQLELGLNPYLVRSTLSATPIPAISSITLEQTEHSLVKQLKIEILRFTFYQQLQGARLFH